MKLGILLIIIVTTGCSPNRNLIGTWRIKTASVLPTQIPSFCDSLTVGDIFIFSPNEIIIITNENDTCENIKYRYVKKDNKIILNTGDMISYLDSVLISHETLSFTNKFTSFPQHTGDQYMDILDFGNTVILTKE
jgi:hypothetical protein